MDLIWIWHFALLIFGFGFVVFFHELGHFLAAKWAGVKVEQFAVGFGQAMLAWRKGIGTRVGSTRKEADRLISAHLNEKYGREIAEPSARQIREAEDALGIGETEYRLNWIPLGGYVKMLGQDDLRPNAQADDERAYNKKSIGARMVIVSAGVIMNIILAAIGFMVLFMTGFNAPAPVVGAVVPDSPAQYATNSKGQPAPLQVGDEIIRLNGTRTHDFTKIFLNAALLDSDETAVMDVRRLDGTVEQIHISPRKDRAAATQFLELGIGMQAIRELRGMERWVADFDREKINQMLPAEMMAIEPGDVIVAVNGRRIEDPTQDYPVFHQALQDFGQPVTLTVRNESGQERQVVVQPRFVSPFGETPLNFLGLVPRTQVVSIGSEQSPVLGKIMPGDVILSLRTADQTYLAPTAQELMTQLNAAGNAGNPVDLVVLRDGQEVAIDQVVPSLRVAPGQYGLGIALGNDDAYAVASSVVEGSAAAAAGIPAGARITHLNDQPVASWYDVHRIVAATGDAPIRIAWETVDGETAQATLSPSADELALVKNLSYSHNLQLAERRALRKASNPAVAAWWGVTETRDFILQFYLTLNRMVTGDISYKNMMGPVGIVHAGTRITERGYDWLLWFLCMISANLAVVNFLPIPIVDGGLFTFLILEKIQGKPLSPKAQSIAQVVGLALLLGIFLLVTYQDISRMFQI